MTAETDLLPLPSGNVAHLIAAQAAKIEALRAERDALREALEDIRSRSAMNWAMRLDPFARLAELGNIHQIADAALSGGSDNDRRG